MAIGIVELNTAMTGINDFNHMRHAEETRGGLEQTHIHNQLSEEVEVKLTNVNNADDANNNQKKFDAKEKGSNEYSGNNGQKKKKEEQNRDGKVVPKYSGFDMKI
ncbi:MAG: hypothetical protein KBS96_05525 [Lachnospiraceae bacterium]|nr:hypothetical protein [Candidatus Colinaster scatohippi]